MTPLYEYVFGPLLIGVSVGFAYWLLHKHAWRKDVTGVQTARLALRDQIESAGGVLRTRHITDAEQSAIEAFERAVRRDERLKGEKSL